MTHTRTALVSTDAPARYAKQLASHLGRKMTVTESGQQSTTLTMDFDGQEASCEMDCSAGDVLGLHARSTDEVALDRMAQVVGSHLERFGEKAGLQVSWTTV